jgi:hypothetical protein
VFPGKKRKGARTSHPQTQIKLTVLSLSMVFVFLWDDTIPAENQGKRAGPPTAIAAKFTDVTSELGVQFQHTASHTSKKYLIETMGSGVALFDYDNDGRLDLFLVNGAPISDPMAKGSIPLKKGAPSIGIVFTIKKQMAALKMLPKKQTFRARATVWVSQWAITTMMASKICM